VSPRAARPAPLAWLMWGLPSALFYFAFMHRVAPGVMARELMQSFEATGTLVGLLSATYFYGYAGLMIPAGLLVDGFGVRRVVAAGGAVMALGTLAMATATGLPALFAGRLAIGLGATVTFIGAMKAAAVWFPPSRFGTMSAVTATVGILGSFTAPLAAAIALLGWRGTLVLVGAISLVCSALCLWLVRDRPDDARQERPPALGAVLLGARAVLANPHTWPPFLAFFFLYSAMGNLMVWGVPFLRDVHGLSLTRAALWTSLTPAAMLVAAPLTGYLSDRVLRRRKLPYTVLALAQLGLWLILTRGAGTLSLPALGVLLFAMGIGGSAFVLTWPIGREVNPPHLAGVAVAVTNLGGFLGAALTQGPFGVILDRAWRGQMVGGARAYPVEAYQDGFWICAACVAGAVVMSLLMRETRGENVFARPARAR